MKLLESALIFKNSSIIYRHWYFKTSYIIPMVYFKVVYGSDLEVEKQRARNAEKVALLG